MAATLTQILGTTRSRKITAQSAGRPILNTFQAGDALTATLTPGEAQASVLSPAVSWISAAAATIQYTITAAQLATSALTPGVYTTTVVVTPISDGQPRAVYRGQVKFEPNAGSEGALTSWATYQDLLNWSSQVAALQDRDDDLAQFARQRNYAMNQHVAMIARRYAPVPGCSWRYVSADGLTAGPYLRRAGSPDGSPAPTRQQVRDWLLTPGRIVLNEDVIEANALLAASMVYGGQAGTNNAYAQLADREHARAVRAMEQAFVEIDTRNSPDGTPIIRVSRDVVYLT